MPSDYELSEYECAEIARALMAWLRIRIRGESALTDWEVLQIIARLGREGDIDVNKH